MEEEKNSDLQGEEKAVEGCDFYLNLYNKEKNSISNEQEVIEKIVKIQMKKMKKM